MYKLPYKCILSVSNTTKFISITQLRLCLAYFWLLFIPSPYSNNLEFSVTDHINFLPNSQPLLAPSAEGNYKRSL